MSDANDLRRRQLAAIHAAKRDLGMDDDLYRDLLQQHTGKRSAGQLNAKQRAKFLSALKAMGFQRQPRKTVGEYPGKPKNMNEMLVKIEAQLADMKLPWSYADAIAKRQFNIDRVAWLKKQEQFSAVIAALYVEQEKRALWGSLNALMAEFELDETDLETRFKLPNNWRRNRKVLEALIDRVLNEYGRQS